VDGDNCSINDNMFTDTNVGVNVRSGADAINVSGNTIRNMDSHGIQVDSGATNVEAFPNKFKSITGDNLNEDGIAYVADGSGVCIFLASEMTDVGTSDIPITGMGGVPYPVPPNGSRAFHLRFTASRSIGSGFTWLRSGTTGDVTDTALEIKTQGYQALHPTFAETIHASYVPAANELVTASIHAGNAGEDILAQGQNDLAQTSLSIFYGNSG
jgi:hypothetical protein